MTSSIKLAAHFAKLDRSCGGEISLDYRARSGTRGVPVLAVPTDEGLSSGSGYGVEVSGSRKL